MGLSTRGLTKSYGGVPVFENIDLDVADGEIHALLGANGAGKSTVIKCISGGVRPDAGKIIVGGSRYESFTPAKAQEAGIAVIHQTPSLALTLSATENIFLGTEFTRKGFLRKKEMQEHARRLLRSLGSDISADANLRTVSNADLQVIEIAKALVRNPKVLILDEATAALSEREVERLADQLAALKARGLPILLVTHRLNEVLELADRVTVLRGGSVVLSENTAALDKDDLVAAIVGNNAGAHARSGEQRRPPSEDTSPLLNIQNLVVPRVGPIDLEVHAGEIVGVFGLVGSGRTELLESIAGVYRPTSGSMQLGTDPYAPRSPYDAAARGVALVPSDRLRKSIFPELSAEANLMLPSLGTAAWARLVRRRRHERSIFSAAASALNLHPFDPVKHARQFSGGNQQKLVIGRWLNSVNACRLLLLDEPTDGVDVGARAELYSAFESFVQSGDNGVLFTSSEPQELIQIADRVIVLSGGHVAGTLTRTELDEHRLLTLAHAGEARPRSEVLS